MGKKRLTWQVALRKEKEKKGTLNKSSEPSR
jgi:hypothetical protein